MFKDRNSFVFIVSSLPIIFSRPFDEQNIDNMTSFNIGLVETLKVGKCL